MFPSFHHSPFLVILLLATGSSLFTTSRLVQSLATTPTPIARPPVPLRFFIGGLGYCGKRLADRLRLEFPDCHISGCVRSEASKQSLLLLMAATATCTSSKSSDPSSSNTSHHNDIAIHVLDLDQEYQGLDEAGLEALVRATHIVQTTAPIADFDRDPLLALHSQTLLQKQAESPCLQWVGYLSSTGVYGDHGGDWVDEDSELKCQDAKSLARVQAEKEWRDFETTMRQQQKSLAEGLPTLRVDCFRCGGIYGPGRGPLATALVRLEAGTLSITEEETSNKEDASGAPTPKYVNRILVDDICGAIVAAVKANIAANTVSQSAGGIYNLVDDDPAPRRHVVDEANRLVRATFPIKANRQTPSLSPSLTASSPPIQNVKRPTSRNTGNKRCKNQRLKDDFHWTLLAPTYREGLRICL